MAQANTNRLLVAITMIAFMGMWASPTKAQNTYPVQPASATISDQPEVLPPGRAQEANTIQQAPEFHAGQVYAPVVQQAYGATNQYGQAYGATNQYGNYQSGCGGDCGCSDNWKGRCGKGPCLFGNVPESYQNRCCFTPFGCRVRQTLNAQIANGYTEQLAFYHFHFQLVDGHTWVFSEAGVANLHRVAKIQQFAPGYIVLQTTGDPEVDGSRRQMVVDGLNKIGLGVTEQEVVVGPARQRGVSGAEAIIIYQRQNDPAFLDSITTEQSFLQPLVLDGGGGGSR